jgi:hypothetical protein
MYSGVWVRSAEQIRVLEESYADGTLFKWGPEWLGEYYENHPSDHAKDLREALENYLQKAEQDELRGLLAGATYALDILDGKEGDARQSSSAQDSGCGQGRWEYTPSLSYYDSSSPEDMLSPEPPAVVNSPEQRLVEDKSARGSPEQERRSRGHGWFHTFKTHVGALRFRRWSPRGKKEARAKEAGEKAGIEPRSPSQEEEGKQK